MTRWCLLLLAMMRSSSLLTMRTPLVGGRTLLTASTSSSTSITSSRSVAIPSISSGSSSVLPPRRPPPASTPETGAFKRRLPDVFEGPTHYRRALKSLKGLKPDSSIKNVRNQQRKLCAQTLDRLGQGLTIPITEALVAYKAVFRDMHPFERTVADLVVQARQKVGLPDLVSLLAELKELRMATSRIAKEYASRAANATSSTEAKDLLQQGMAHLESLYSGNVTTTVAGAATISPDSSNVLPDGTATITTRPGPPLSLSLGSLVDLQKELRKIPVVELSTPTVVLVGAPNVGKSSLVRVVSTGTPEVNDYPFTTRGVTIGHVINADKQIRFQVMDTPGLLDRPQEERNEMERLTFASLAHLPTAVIFVVDPSGLSGDQSSLERQLNVRAMLRQRFPLRPWLDVVSKGDLDIPDSVLETIRSRGAGNFLQVSVESGLNVDVLRDRIEVLFEDLQTQLAERERAERGEVSL